MKKIATLILVFIFAAGLVSCGEENIAEKNAAVFYEYFDTVTQITAYGKDKAEFDQNCTAVQQLLEEYHRLMDIYRPYDGINNLYTVNKSAGKEPVKVDKKLIDAVLYGKELYELTNGEMNIAFGSVTSLWHSAREDGTYIPTQAELEKAAAHCNIDDLVVDTENCTIFLRDENMSVDMGALGKGYACEMAARLLEEAGAEGYALNIGGNIRVTGKKTEKDYWSAGIQNPDTASAQAYVCTVWLKENALVTSGSYIRYYTVDGVTYHHIIDTQTLYPKNEFLSVSVLCGDSALGDALSTALFNMSLEEGKNLVEGLENTSAVWVDKNGNVFYSNGFEEYIK